MSHQRRTLIIAENVESFIWFLPVVHDESDGEQDSTGYHVLKTADASEL